jgi:hypothetical protein
VSSAKRRGNLEALGRLFIYSMKNKGPEMHTTLNGLVWGLKVD